MLPQPKDKKHDVPTSKDVHEMFPESYKDVPEIQMMMNTYVP